LTAAAELIFSQSFVGRVLAFDEDAAKHFAQIAASLRSQGRVTSEADVQIAAIARAHVATLATRNVRHFNECGIQLVNPWQS